MNRYIIASGLLVIFCMHSTYCQNNIPQINDLKFGMVSNYYDTKIPAFKLKEKSGFPESFFLQFGGEYGIGSIDGSKGKEKGVFWDAFIDINLFSKKLFLKLEVGQVLNSERSSDGLGYYSIGLNYRFMKNKQHNIYVHFGLGFFRQPIAVILSSKYMFSINKFVGLSIGPRFIYSTWDEHSYLGILAGVQIFAN